MRTFFALAVLLTFSRLEARPALSPDRLTRLENYQVLVFADPTESGLERGKAIGVIDAPPREVFRVVTDFSAWPSFLPRVASAQVVSQTADGTQVDVVINLPWPVGRTLIAANYTTERLPGEIYRVRFERISGGLKQYLGTMYIEPWTTGKTAITYELVAEPNVHAPVSLINHGVRRSTSSFVHALRQRINALLWDKETGVCVQEDSSLNARCPQYAARASRRLSVAR